MTNWLIIAGLVTISALAYAVYKEIQTRTIVKRIQKMLEEAINGEFVEKEFSENKLSKLESTMADYLQSSAVSANNVKNDRDKIKTLIADISHQTKTPIANLLLHSELLNETELSDDQRESLTAIGNEAEKLRFLVDALVKLSRLENGILALEPKEDDLSRVVSDVGNALRLKAEGKGLYLHVTKDSEKATFDYKWTLEAVSVSISQEVLRNAEF